MEAIELPDSHILMCTIPRASLGRVGWCRVYGRASMTGDNEGGRPAELAQCNVYREWSLLLTSTWYRPDDTMGTTCAVRRRRTDMQGTSQTDDFLG